MMVSFSLALCSCDGGVVTPDSAIDLWSRLVLD